MLADPTLPQVGHQAVRAWVTQAVDGVRAYLGEFPVEQLFLAIHVRGPRGVTRGQALATDPPTLNITIGARTTPTQLRNDWILVHEMVHLAVPSQPRRHRWFEEGLAVYAESIIRLHAGLKTRRHLWRDFYEGMPLGSRAFGEAGRDGASRWGRVYWASTTFMLRVDVAAAMTGRPAWPRIFRAWRQLGWDIRRRVSMAELIEAGDAALATPLLRQHFDRYAKEPGELQARTLLKRLGVMLRNGQLVVDDAAAAAAARQRIEQPLS